MKLDLPVPVFFTLFPNKSTIEITKGITVFYDEELRFGYTWTLRVCWCYDYKHRRGTEPQIRVRIQEATREPDGEREGRWARDGIVLHSGFSAASGGDG